MRISDWSSDVCSSDLQRARQKSDVARDQAEARIDVARKQIEEPIDDADAFHRSALPFLAGTGSGRQRLRQAAALAVEPPPVHFPGHAAAGILDMGGHRAAAGQLGTQRIGRHRGGKGICLDHRSEEHKSELQSLMSISYAAFCLKKKKK